MIPRKLLGSPNLTRSQILNLRLVVMAKMSVIIELSLIGEIRLLTMKLMTIRLEIMRLQRRTIIKRLLNLKSW